MKVFKIDLFAVKMDIMHILKFPLYCQSGGTFILRNEIKRIVIVLSSQHNTIQLTKLNVYLVRLGLGLG